MDFEYSPHRTGGTLHLLSPTHPHIHQTDTLASIKQLRRSLSRSPSKINCSPFRPPRSPSRSPNSPCSPSRLSQVFLVTSSHSQPSPQSGAGDAQVAQSPTTSRRARPSLHRASPYRTAPASTTRSAHRSPMRRALSDNGNGIATPSRIQGGSGSENDSDEVEVDKSKSDTSQSCPRFELDTEPVKFDAFSVRNHHPAAALRRSSSIKSSPLKRSDGVMNLELASFGSPRVKRRSLHGASFESSADMFERLSSQGNAPNTVTADMEREVLSAAPHFTLTPEGMSPARKSPSLRRSTLQQRHASATVRPPLFTDVDHGSTWKPHPRKSLENAFPKIEDSNTKDFAVPSLQTQAVHRAAASHQHPHPLSHALTQSPSDKSIPNESFPRSNQSYAPVPTGRVVSFSKSLPIGSTRPVDASFSGESSNESSQTMSTPSNYKMAKPLPAAFLSTGLISKRNRTVENVGGSFFANQAMPDTPLKKFAHHSITATPGPRSGLANVVHAQPEFGTPSSPWSPHQRRVSAESFGHGVSIFGSRPSRPSIDRRGSFLSIEGDDIASVPSGPIESQSSNDDLPPTPTKQSNVTSRPQSKGKGNSLRSSLLGRRTSLGPDTFLPPESISPSVDTVTDNNSTPQLSEESSNNSSPHTPQEHWAPPDASRLSISAERPETGHDRLRSSTTTNSSNALPATPTAPREQWISFGSSFNGGASAIGMTNNDVDTVLTARFDKVILNGRGEFSEVYRVEEPINDGVERQRQSGATRTVWAVKKSRKPYIGHRDRQRKLREAEVLKVLKDHEHVVGFVHSWEAKNHLYIQTEYCENGNLKAFLDQAGRKARLDDFRVWKILLEMSQGLRFIHDSSIIHLDLKPANILIDWEGCLKIADFGMATFWPAPKGIEGEGDREYIGPEVLAGRFDKPADVFALGMIMLEIAGNIVLPDNGTSWQRLRRGDLSDLPSLTWSSDSSLVRNESGEPISEIDHEVLNLLSGASSHDTLLGSDMGDNDTTLATDLTGNSFLSSSKKAEQSQLVRPPRFMMSADDAQSLENVVRWMIQPDPDRRPLVDQILLSGGVQWVERRRRAGATIYEGNWGPADDVLGVDVEVDVDDTHIAEREDVVMGGM